MFSYRPLHIGEQVLDNHQELIYNSSVRPRDVISMTCQKQ